MVLLCQAFALSKVRGWVTLNGTHVLIDKIGNIVGGPEALIGKNYKQATSELSSEKPVNTGWVKLGNAYAKLYKGIIVKGQKSVVGKNIGIKKANEPPPDFPTEKKGAPESLTKDPDVKVRAARYKVDGQIRYYKEYMKTPIEKLSYPLPPPTVGQQRYSEVVAAKNAKATPQVKYRELITRREADAFKEGVYHGDGVRTKK